MSVARIIATLTHRPSPDELATLSTEADTLEVRADLLGELDPSDLRRHFSGSLLYTLRSRAEGGEAAPDGEERGRRLAAAAESYETVDLEGARDLTPEVLAAVPAEKRVISWHGPGGGLEELRGRFAAMAAEPARFYKLVPAAGDEKHALAALALLHSLGRPDVAAFASGEAWTWTRLLAPRLGAPLVYGAAGGEPAAPGQPSVKQLRHVFGLPNLAPVERIFGVVGLPVSHSLSPLLHNVAYREQGLPYLYLPFEAGTFGDFWLDVVESGSLRVLGFELGGLSVTAPYKEIALAVAGAPSPLADRIGSANTLVRRSGVWEAESTDSMGVVAPLRERLVELGERRAAVIGSGGAGRAAAFGLARAGVDVTLVNRGVERGRRVASELSLAFAPLTDFRPESFDLLVNATPLGREGGDELPFALERLAARAIVVDLSYLADRPTRLVSRARERGLTAIDGREVLLCQALPQYRMMTGNELRLDRGRRILGLEPAG